MENIIVTETGNPEYPMRLDVTIDGVDKVFFGQGVVGCPEGASWWDIEGNEVSSDALRQALKVHSECLLRAARVVALRALVGQ